MTLGSGQASTYYGDAYHIVLSGEYVTPAGDFKTLDYPGTATGPKVNDIMKGSEGTFGILVEVTMRIFRYMPENRQRFAYMFPTWEAAVEASREVMQGEFGMPAVYRISDPEETDVGLKLYGIHGTPVDTFMTLRGFKPMQRCLMHRHGGGRERVCEAREEHDRENLPGNTAPCPSPGSRRRSGSTPATRSPTCARTSRTTGSSSTRWSRP